MKELKLYYNFKKIHWGVLTLCLFFPIIFSLVPFCQPLGAQTYTVRPGHPRVYITPENLPEIRDKCAGTSPKGNFSGEYKILLNYANANANWNLDPNSLTSSYKFMFPTLIYSFLYKAGIIQGFTYIHTPLDYGNKAKEFLLVHSNLILSGKCTEDQVATAITLLISYDWLYDLLNESERQLVVNAMINYTDRMILFWDARIKDYIKTRTYLPGNFMDAWFIITGFAFYGDGINDTKAQEYLNKFDEYWINWLLKFQETQAVDDGGDENHIAYGASCDVPRTFDVLELLTTATDKNFFQDSYFARYLPQWLTYMFTFTSQFLSQGDGPSPWTPERIPFLGYWQISDYTPADPIKCQLRDMRLALMSSASRNKSFGYNDMASLAVWLINKVSSEGDFIYGSYAPEIFKIIRYDKSIQAKSPSQLLLPLTKKFDGIGTVAMRSGWNLDSPGDTAAVFLSMPPSYYGGHGYYHADENSFLIEKKGELAIDTYTRVSAPDYYKLVVSHNTMVIGNVGNTYGQLISSKGPGITEFESTPEYDYILGDQSNTYGTGVTFTRQFVYLRPLILGGNDFFIVFDRVKTPTATDIKRWILRLPSEPYITGNEFTVPTGDHTHLAYDGDLVRADALYNAGGRLFSKTLLPSPHIIKKIGGEGHEAEDINYVNKRDPTKIWRPWMGWGRIEVEPTIPALEDHFLQVLYPCDITVNSMPPTSLVESPDPQKRVQGAKITDITGQMIDVDNLVLFSGTGENLSVQTILLDGIYDLGVPNKVTPGGTERQVDFGGKKYLITKLPRVPMEVKPATGQMLVTVNQYFANTVEFDANVEAQADVTYTFHKLRANFPYKITIENIDTGELTVNSANTNEAGNLSYSTTLVANHKFTLVPFTLIINKSADKPDAVPGDIITYTITYTNEGTTDVTDVVITDVIPANTTFILGSAKLNGTPMQSDPFQDGKIVVNIGTVTPGATGTITFQVKVE